MTPGAGAAGRYRIHAIISVLALSLGALPGLLYVGVFGRVPAVSPGGARAMLAAGSTVLIDTREPEEYDAGHVQGSFSWPYESIMRIRSRGDIPELFRGRRMILVCGGGMESAAAARALGTRAGADAYPVAGGLQAWYNFKVPESRRLEAYYSIEKSCGIIEGFPYRVSSLAEQIAVCACAFGVKPLYMAASLALAILLLRRRERGLAALGGALAAFFAGEAFCAVNYLFYGEGSVLMEYLHMYGMILSFGFFTYALVEGIDGRILHFSDRGKKCAFAALCRGCYKQGDAPCRLRQSFQLVLAFLLIVSAVPLLTSVRPVSYNTDIFGVFYNYTHQVPFQVYEKYVAPLMALALFAAALSILSIIRERAMPAVKIIFSAGMGLLGFSLFRVLLFSLYRDNMAWFVCWEEITEFLYIAGVGFFLWTFRKGLFAATVDAVK